MANIAHGGVIEAILSSSQQNVGEDIFPDPVNLVSSPVTVAAAIVGSQEEGEVLASQETARLSSQRFFC
jgi:class 3 adenylate cyclase